MTAAATRRRSRPGCAAAPRRCSAGSSDDHVLLDVRTITDEQVRARRPRGPVRAGGRRPRRRGLTVTGTLRVIATAGHVDHGKSVADRRRSPGSTPIGSGRGEAPRTHDRPRLRVDARSRAAGRSGSSTCPGTSGSSATCSPASGPSGSCCSSSRPTRAGSRSPRSTCRSSTCSGSRGGVIALTKTDLVDDGDARARDRRGARAGRGHGARRRADRARERQERRGLRPTCSRRSTGSSWTRPRPRTRARGCSSTGCSRSRARGRS